MKLRYLPKRAFPSYIFIPGSNPHPMKPGGHMEGESDPVVLPLDPSRPSDSDILRYSLDLLNHGYFWESHVYFEALWNAHKREGSTADFLKGMIKIGAAGVKMNLGQKQSAIGHIERAMELFQEVRSIEGEMFLGFNLNDILNKLDLFLVSQDIKLEIHPVWE